MNKKNIIIIIAICLVAVLSMVFILIWFLGDKGNEQTGTPQTVKLSWNFGYKKDAWQAVAEAYNEKNPFGHILVLDEQSGANYDQWLRTELLDSKSTTSIVLNYGVSEYFSQNKFVNFNGYVQTANPYNDNQVWKSTMQDSAFIPTGTNREVYNINYETTATCWYYNKDLFAEHQLTPPTNWDELIALCEVLESKGITPLSISADSEGLISWQIGWLFRLYSDQFFREEAELALAIPGDYCYDSELQKNFTFDKTDVNNDAEQGFVVNYLRFMKLVKDGVVGPDTAKFKALLGELMRLIPTYVPENFLTMNTSDSQRTFINGNAAMYIGLMEFGAGWERTINDSGTANIFELGNFNNPPMTHQLRSVDYVRSMGGASGTLGIVNRNKAHNDAAADFLKYFTSIEGQSLYFQMLSELDVAPSGPSLVKNVVMPQKWAGVFENISYNGLADNNPMTFFSRGFWEVASTNTTYVGKARNLFEKSISIDDYCIAMQAECIKGINKKISTYDWRTDALDDVTRNPKPTPAN